MNRGLNGSSLVGKGRKRVLGLKLVAPSVVQLVHWLLTADPPAVRVVGIRRGRGEERTPASHPPLCSFAGLSHPFPRFHPFPR